MPRLLLLDDKLKDFETLTRHVLTTKLSASQVEAAVASLALLNPHVNLKKLRAGSVLVLPDSPNFKGSAGDAVGAGAFETFEGATRSALNETVRQLKAQGKLRAAERDELTQALKLAQKNQPELKAPLESAAKSLAAEARRDEESEAAFADAARIALKELQNLGSRHFK